MADPTTVYQTQTGIAPELQPYAESLLGQAQAYTDVAQNPYQSYTGEQVAQFSPLQQQSYDYAQQLTSAPQLQDATAMAGQAGLGALNTQYTYKPSDFSSADAARLMSPYMQNVVDVQEQQAKRQAAIQNQAMQAQAANAGAFGGGRQGIMQAQANAELQRNLQGIQATGLQNAFQNAQQQYNTQNQLNAQQQQFGAGLGLQGLQTANQAATNLANIGNTQYNQNMGINQMQAQYGGVQQQQLQNDINNKYQDYLNNLNYPYQQLSFMSNLLRGLPMTNQTAQVYQQPPSMLSQVAGAGITGKALGLFKDGGKVKSAGLVDLAIAKMA